MYEADRRRPGWVYGVGTEPDPRFSLANERTLLAWIRTGTAFAAGGGGVLIARELIGPLALLLSVSAFLLSLTIVVGAVTRWARMERALRMEQPLPAPLLAAMITGALAVGALVGLVVNAIVS